VISEANAGLIDRGNGLIYDNVQDITWLQDANFAKTSGYAYEGEMSWFESLKWADELIYAGYDDWRLFDAAPEDTNCSEISAFHDDTQYGYNCTTNELGHLFYNEFGLTKEQSILDARGDTEFDLFVNVVDYAYWTGTDYNPTSAYAMLFATSGGYQSFYRKHRRTTAWAVRDGDVATVVAKVPEPTSIGFFALGLVCLVSRRCKKQA